ncbi:MAG: hypothetical protein IPL60_19010 [Ardenticatenia bacterium]|nr:hypothetical protein [Ardenticatenia bacterium]
MRPHLAGLVGRVEIFQDVLDEGAVGGLEPQAHGRRLAEAVAELDAVAHPVLVGEKLSGARARPSRRGGVVSPPVMASAAWASAAADPSSGRTLTRRL